ncbi:MAG: hypothetical protein QXW52_07115 [Candidatus Caldarchaeum sp.]
MSSGRRREDREVDSLPVEEERQAKPAAETEKDRRDDGRSKTTHVGMKPGTVYICLKCGAKHYFPRQPKKCRNCGNNDFEERVTLIGPGRVTV